MSHLPPSPLLSIVMPVYNEAKSVAEAVEEIRRDVFSAVPQSELVAVDDGSTDGSGILLDQIAVAEPRLRVLHKPNGGHGSAVMAGVGAAAGEYVLLIDSDRQIPLDGFRTLWAQAATISAVLGVRWRRQDPAFRRVLSLVIRLFIRLLFGVRIRDANAPFKIFRKDLWLGFTRLAPAGALAPSLLFAVYLKKRCRAVVEADVVHRRRMDGSSKIRRWRLLRFCARGFLQLVAFRASLERTRNAPSMGELPRGNAR